MAILTKQQIEKLVQIIKDHATWLRWRLAGDKAVDPKDIQRLKDQGILPMDVSANTIKMSYVLGELEALLKEGEWKNLTYDQLVNEVTRKQTDLQLIQIDKAEMSAQTAFRGLENDISNGLFSQLASATQKTLDEGVVRGYIKDTIKLGVEARKNYREVARDLVDTLKEPKRNWHRVASTEMHAARQAGIASTIIEKQDIYKYSDGEDSDVAVIPDPDACDDCKRLYLGKDGNPKIFKLSTLLANSGTNYIKPWRKNAKPVVPPLHPHCFCTLQYVPEGWGFDKKGRFTVTDTEKYEQSVKRAGDVSKSHPHSLLEQSKRGIEFPTEQDIQNLKDSDDAMEMVDHLWKLAKLHADDYEAYKHFHDLADRAMNQAYILDNGGLAQYPEEEEPDASQQQ